MDWSSVKITSVTAAIGDDGARAYTGWTAQMMFVDTPTGDGRTFEGAGWKQSRALPLTLMFQGEETGLGGHSGSYPIGMITGLAVKGNAMEAVGSFDDSDQAQEAAGMIADGVVTGISADLAIRLMEVTYPPMVSQTADGTPIDEVPPDEPVTVVESSEDVMMLARDWEVMGATVLPFPGFANASIAVANDDSALPEPVAAASDSLGTDQTLAVVLIPDPAEGDQHLTLAIVADTGDDGNPVVQQVVEEWAAAWPALQGQVTGAGLLGDPASPALVSLVSCIGMAAARTDLVAMLSGAGVMVATDYDFVPHVTVQADGAEAATMDSVPVGSDISFPQVAIWNGDSQALGEPLTLSGAHRDDVPADDLQTVTASVTLRPPADWFYTPEPSQLTALTVDDDGRLSGHLAPWGACHTGGGCTVQPPSDCVDYDASFHLGAVRCDDGRDVPVGPLVLDAFHADVNLDWSAAVDHYAHTGCLAGFVRVVDGEFGPWVSGMVRPGLGEEQVIDLRASKMSGDWRAWQGSRQHGLLGILAVNGPGFPVPRALVAASGPGEDPDVLALTGVGLGLPEATEAARAGLTTSVRVLTARAKGGIPALIELARSA